MPKIEVSEALIALNAKPRDKEHAMRLLMDLWTHSGKVQEGYLEGMKQRELQENTYLGQGIAIPHGTPETRRFIQETSIAVLHVPEGISWGAQGELAYLLVGIAALGDEHLTILRRLTRILNQPEALQQLLQAADKASILRLLNDNPAEQSALAEAKPKEVLPFSAKVVIPNPQGIHARPASKLARICKQLGGKMVLVTADGRRADPAKMIEVLSLGLTQGSLISIETEQREVLERLVQEFATGLGDDLTVHEEEQGQSALWTVVGEIEKVQGVSASDGLTIGTIRHFQNQQYTLPTEVQSALQEAQALDAALFKVETQLRQSITEMSSEYGEIFEAHILLLQDQEWLGQAVLGIEQGQNAARAYHQAAEQQIQRLQALDNALLAARAHDVADVRDRVIRAMLGLEETSFSFPEGTILCADDLAPSDTAKLDPKHLVGLVTAQGGPTSHTAILARGMGLPAVVALGSASLQRLEEGATVILDARAAMLYLNPTPEQISSAQTAIANLQTESALAQSKRHEPCLTQDGRELHIVANANNVRELESALNQGAQGVGLMRTEALYLDQIRIPTESEQEGQYVAMARLLGDKPLIIRTLDIGGDKEVPYLGLEEERNAFLGMRGIRLCLARPDLFIPQLRAIARAAKQCRNIHVMFPMVATLADWRRAKALWEEIAREIGAVDVPVGVMIEVPSAALIAETLAKEVSFFSIGTNDLTQYTLAMDRMNAELAKQTDPLHPAVLQLVDRTVRAAEKEGKWVGVCGSAAGDVLAAQIFVGLGVKELSVSGREVGAIKQCLRESDYRLLAERAQSALACADGAEVRALFNNHL
ncbi:MAG: phosphoenolpyruvate--protein phosphotransferase [Cardiobacteriaceae bacterium]|nr:phosphoenolpyruvate--protein phosphotransferase [Cardiobacteriaceae bacterium]